MNALRQIFYAETPERGKILHLPGLMPHLQYVVGQDMRFTHAEDERTQDIAYTLTLVKVGVGRVAAENGSTGNQSGQNQGATKGRHTRKFSVDHKRNTLRKIAKVFLGNSNRWTALYADGHNSKFFTKRNVPTHQIPDYRLPLGTVIWIP